MPEPGPSGERQLAPGNQEVGGFLDTETQFLSVDLQQLPAGPKPAQTQFREGAGADHELTPAERAALGRPA